MISNERLKITLCPKKTQMIDCSDLPTHVFDDGLIFLDHREFINYTNRKGPKIKDFFQKVLDQISKIRTSVEELLSIAQEYKIHYDNVLGSFSVIRDGIKDKPGFVDTNVMMYDILTVIVDDGKLLKEILCTAAFIDFNNCLGFWDSEHRFEPLTCLSMLYASEISYYTLERDRYASYLEDRVQLYNNITSVIRTQIPMSSLNVNFIMYNDVDLTFLTKNRPTNKRIVSSNNNFRLGLPHKNYRSPHVPIDVWSEEWLKFHKKVMTYIEMSRNLNIHRNKLIR